MAGKVSSFDAIFWVCVSLRGRVSFEHDFGTPLAYRLHVISAGWLPG